MPPPQKKKKKKKRRRRRSARGQMTTQDRQMSEGKRLVRRQTG
jgi:hypothetical protein